MKSINKLKEELEKEKYANQDNVRAKIIERMKKDILENETVIEMMRTMINDDEAINKEIVKTLSKGAPRERVLSREELRMEIKRLSGEVTSLKAGGATKRKKRKVSTAESVDHALEESFDNMTFENFKSMKNTIEELKTQIDNKQKEIDDVHAQIDELKDEKKVTGISLHSLMDKVKNMDTDKQLFERVKLKLKEFKNSGIFRGIELEPDEEEDDEIINLLNRLIKLLDKTKLDVELREKEQKQLKELLDRNQKDRVKEVDDLVDEYNVKDEELQGVHDKYIALKKDMKMKMFEVAKYKEEMEDAQRMLDDLKEEQKTKGKGNKGRIQELEEEAKHKDNRINELQNEIEHYLQRSPARSDTSTESDPRALLKERKKVSKLMEEIKRLYDQIDKLNTELNIEREIGKDQTLDKVRSKSRGRQL
jgi:chromosome segregation ATPase